jgi:hypothetical protein
MGAALTASGTVPRPSFWALQPHPYRTSSEPVNPTHTYTSRPSQHHAAARAGRSARAATTMTSMHSRLRQEIRPKSRASRRCVSGNTGVRSSATKRNTRTSERNPLRAIAYRVERSPLLLGRKITIDHRRAAPAGLDNRPKPQDRGPPPSNRRLRLERVGGVRAPSVNLTLRIHAREIDRRDHGSERLRALVRGRSTAGSGVGLAGNWHQGPRTRRTPVHHRLPQVPFCALQWASQGA